MASRTHNQHPAQGRAEEAPDIPELGHLVAEMGNYEGVMDWANSHGVHGNYNLGEMIGETDITLNGRSAKVGWLTPGGSPFVPRTTAPEIIVKSPGGEDFILVKGSLGAMIQSLDGSKDRTVDELKASSDQSPSLRLNYGDTINLLPHVPYGSKCWFVRLAAEDPTTLR